MNCNTDFSQQALEKLFHVPSISQAHFIYAAEVADGQCFIGCISLACLLRTNNFSLTQTTRGQCRGRQAIKHWSRIHTCRGHHRRGTAETRSLWCSEETADEGVSWFLAFDIRAKSVRQKLRNVKETSHVPKRNCEDSAFKCAHIYTPK